MKDESTLILYRTFSWEIFYISKIKHDNNKKEIETTCNQNHTQNVLWSFCKWNYKVILIITMEIINQLMNCLL